LLLESSSANPINGPNSIEKNLSAGDVWSNDIVSKMNIEISEKKQRKKTVQPIHVVLCKTPEFIRKLPPCSTCSVKSFIAKSGFLKYLGSRFIASIVNNIKECITVFSGLCHCSP
jgi:hypothetical protein